MFILILIISFRIHFNFEKVVKKSILNQHLRYKNTGNQAVSLRSFPLFRSAVPVGRAFLRSTDTSQHKKIRQPKNRQPYFFRCSFLIFTRSLPAFCRAYASTIQLHFVTVIRSLNAPFHSASSSLIRFTAFQPYDVCRPQFFQRLLLRTAIGVGSAPFLLRFPFLETLYFD